MKFLCQKHRDWLQSDPIKALHLWHKTTEDARQAVRDENWRVAIMNYGNAFDIAELLIDCDNFSIRAQERYAYTALEMAYTLKSKKLDTRWLVHALTDKLKDQSRSQLTEELIGSLASLEAPKASNVSYIWQATGQQTRSSNYSRQLH